MSQEETVPQMHINIKRIAAGADGSARFRWSVTMMASDAKGERTLGYRGSGIIEGDLTGLQFETGPEVHDESRPVWTTMNQTDRPDIRKKIADLARKAAEKLKKSGEDMFEHIVP
jgi:hypothetical protein